MISIVYDKTENIAVVRKIASAINHKEIHKINYITVLNKATYKGVVILVGTSVIRKYLGAGVSGRNSTIKVDDIWYLTVPNINSLYFKHIAERAAKQIIRAIHILENPEFKLPTVPYTEVTTLEQLKILVNAASNSSFVSFDFETNNMLQIHDPAFRATCLGIMFNPNMAFIINQNLLYNKDAVGLLQTLFQQQGVVKIAHNLSFDFRILRKLGITPKGQFACTKLMSFLVDENSPNGLKDYVDTYLPQLSGYDYHADFTKEVDNDLYSYLAVDCFATYHAYCNLLQYLVDDKILYITFRNLYMAGFKPLQDIEYNGCFIDKVYLEHAIIDLETIIIERELELQEIPEVRKFVINRNTEKVNEAITNLLDKIAVRAEKFNSDTDKHINNWKQQLLDLRSGAVVLVENCDFASTKELGSLLYTDLGFNFPNPMRKDSKTKKLVESASTDKEALNDIDHPIGDKLRAIRTFKLLLSTFYRGILDKVIDGKVYASFNQTGTATGRLSSNSPNLQNLPTRVHIDDDVLKSAVKGVKKAFIPPKGYVVLQADLSQAELRVIAHYSKDDTMIEAYRNNIDLHAITGARIARMEYEDFIQHPDFKQFRTIAKSSNFGLVYDISDDGYIAYIKNMTGQVITPRDAKLHRQSVFGAYPKLKEWHNNMETLATKDGFVRTIFGVKRRLPDIHSTALGKKAEARRYAINAPIQGSIGGWAVWLLVWLRFRLDPDIIIFNTVHDSVVLYVPESKLIETAKLIVSTAYDIPFSEYFNVEPMAVPLKIDVEAGPTYGELDEVILD